MARLLADEIADFVNLNFAHSYCLRCIGESLQVRAQDVSDACQVLVGPRGFRMVHRRCYSCRTFDVLIAGGGGAPAKKDGPARAA